jgi:hypothetical protein
MKEEITQKQLRSFGLMVGFILGGVAIWPLIVRGEDVRLWALLPAVFLTFPAVVYPAWLTWFYKRWMWIGLILGWVNTRIILGFIFYLVVAPTGMLRRWLGKDPMGRQLRPDVDSYRVVRDPRPCSHLTKQY